ncbi:NAD(P)-binding domain-containing protein [Actinokineospora enzanensis]|uniref:imine reductase family protein n=1 Tax=Actinokineospora enzanensis TaxID=155975 RepID=UPI00039F1B8F|nr:NAD(P)-binding domain-containing protein [Actinokineospora enzanensis]
MTVTLLGLGAMGTALATAWRDTGVTVWNRTPRQVPGTIAAATPAAAIAANDLVVVCLLDDRSVTEVLADADLAGKDVVNLTTGSPGQARARAGLMRARGARFLDGGIMAVPAMIGTPTPGHTLYSGSRELFDDHERTLAVPTAARYVGTDPGFAALYDIALLSGMYGMFAGVTHARALIGAEAVDRAGFTELLTGWLRAMSASAADPGAGAGSSLAMQVAGIRTFELTAREQGVDPALLAPYFTLMARGLTDGEPDLARLLTGP